VTPKDLPSGLPSVAMDDLDPTHAGARTNTQRPGFASLKKPSVELPPVPEDDGDGGDSSGSRPNRAIVAEQVLANTEADALAELDEPGSVTAQSSRLDQWLDEVINQPEPSPEQMDYAKEFHYLEYVVAKFSADLNTYLYDINKIGRLCVALSNDWEHGTISNLVEFIQGDVLPDVVNRQPSHTMQRLIEETLVVISQMLSRSILTLARMLASTPLMFVAEESEIWRMGEVDGEVRRELLIKLNRESSEWRAYVEAVMQYHFAVTVPHSAHGLVFKVTPFSNVTIDMLREYAEAQSRLLPRSEYKTLGDLPANHPVLQHTRGLFGAASNLYTSPHGAKFVEEMLRRLCPLTEAPVHFVETFFDLLDVALTLPTHGIAFNRMLKREMVKMNQGGHPLGADADDESDSDSAMFYLIANCMRNVLLIADQEDFVPEAGVDGNATIPAGHTLRFGIPMVLKAARMLVRDKENSGGSGNAIEDLRTLVDNMPRPDESDTEMTERKTVLSDEMRQYITDGPVEVDRDLQEVIAKQIFPTREQQEGMDLNQKVVQQLFFGLLTQADGSRAVRASVNNGRGFGPQMMQSYANMMSEALEIPVNSESPAGLFYEASQTSYSIGNMAHPFGIMGTAHRLHTTTQVEANPAILEHELMGRGQRPWVESGNGIVFDWMERVKMVGEMHQSMQDKLAPHVARFIRDFQTHPSFPEFAVGLVRDAAANAISPETAQLAATIHKELAHPDHKYLVQLARLSELDERMATDEIYGRGCATLCRKYRFPASFASSHLLNTFVCALDDDEIESLEEGDGGEEGAVGEGVQAEDAGGDNNNLPTSDSLAPTNNRSRLKYLSLEPIAKMSAESNYFVKLALESIEVLCNGMTPYLGKKPKLKAEGRYLIFDAKLQSDVPIVEKVNTRVDTLVTSFDLYMRPFQTIIDTNRVEPASIDPIMVKFSTSEVEQKLILLMVNLTEAIRDGTVPVMFEYFENHRSLYYWFMGEFARIVFAFFAWQYVDFGIVVKVMGTAGLDDPIKPIANDPLSKDLTAVLNSVISPLDTHIDAFNRVVVPDRYLAILPEHSNDTGVKSVAQMTAYLHDLITDNVVDADGEIIKATVLPLIEPIRNKVMEMAAAVDAFDKASIDIDRHDGVIRLAQEIAEKTNNLMIGMDSYPNVADAASYPKLVTRALAYAVCLVFVFVRKRFAPNQGLLNLAKGSFSWIRRKAHDVASKATFGVLKARAKEAQDIPGFAPTTLGECLSNYLDRIDGASTDMDDVMLLKIIDCLHILATACDKHKHDSNASLWNWKQLFQTVEGQKFLATFFTTLGIPYVTSATDGFVTAAAEKLRGAVTGPASAAYNYFSKKAPESDAAQEESPTATASTTVVDNPVVVDAKPVGKLDKPARQQAAGQLKSTRPKATAIDPLISEADAADRAKVLVGGQEEFIPKLLKTEEWGETYPVRKNLVNSAFSQVFLPYFKDADAISKQKLAVALVKIDAATAFIKKDMPNANATLEVAENIFTSISDANESVHKSSDKPSVYMVQVNRVLSYVEGVVKEYMLTNANKAHDAKTAAAEAQLAGDRESYNLTAPIKIKGEGLAYVEERENLENLFEQEKAMPESLVLLKDRMSLAMVQGAASACWSAAGQTALFQYELIAFAFNKLTLQDRPNMPHALFDYVRNLSVVELKKLSLQDVTGTIQRIARFTNGWVAWALPTFRQLYIHNQLLIYGLNSLPLTQVGLGSTLVHKLKSSIRGKNDPPFNPQKIEHVKTDPRYVFPAGITERGSGGAKAVAKIAKDVRSGDRRARLLLIGPKHAFVNETTVQDVALKVAARTALSIPTSIVTAILYGTVSIPAIIDTIAQPENMLSAVCAATATIVACSVMRCAHARFTQGITETIMDQVEMHGITKTVKESDPFTMETLRGINIAIQRMPKPN
jgi:hypothetical protein